MSNEIVLYKQVQEPIKAIFELGEVITKSGMFGCEKIEQGVMLAWQCFSQQVTPMDISNRFHIIGGRLCMKSDAMLGEFHMQGGQSVWEQFDDQAAIGVFTKPGGKPIRISFTAEDAKKAGYMPARPGSGWAKSPDAMLRARCISKMMRMLMPERIAGLYTPEEIADLAPDKPAAPPLPTLTESRVLSSEIIPAAQEETPTLSPSGNPAPKPTQATTEDSREPMTEDQRKRVAVLLTGCGMTDRQEALKYINKTLGTTISSSRELTRGQGDKLIHNLENWGENEFERLVNM